jgi:hypothetical protein
MKDVVTIASRSADPGLIAYGTNLPPIWKLRAGLVEENDDEPAGQPATAGTVNSWEAPNEP